MSDEMSSEIVIPGWSEGPDPESRDSPVRNRAPGFDAAHRPGMTGKKRHAVRILATLVVLALCFSVTFAAWVSSLGPLPLADARKVSTTIVDRNGKLLRAYAMANGRWRLPVDAKKDVDPSYI